MSDEPQLEAWEVLKEFGFKPDAAVLASDIRPGLSFDFGNFKLSASAVMAKCLLPIVSFTSVLATRRTLTDVHFEMPRRIESREKCAAWLAWNLDQCSDGPFRPRVPAPWLQTGRANLRLLPWYFDQEAYDARPHCTVDREWARPLLKKLKGVLEKTPAEEMVWCSFDGEILRIRCGKELLATAAEGMPWKERYGLKADKLKRLPLRLMQQGVGVSVWDGHLELANCRYEGVVSERLPPDAVRGMECSCEK